jgi:CMP/dCMP kinase
MIIAIDGMAASGKGELVKFLAKHYSCEFLPTGNLYRVVAKKFIEDGLDIDKFVISLSKKDILNILNKADILDTSLVSDIISQTASKIAKVKEIRQLLTGFQREWIKKRKTAIVEGRDVGTVVWPEAEVKLFLIADPKIRARRRTNQLREKGDVVLEKEIYFHLVERDKRDSTRTVAPMKMAKDAILLDTTNLTIEEMQQKAVKLIEKKIDNFCGKV